MLWTIFVILLVLWLLGFGFHVGGGLIHLLLVVAVISVFKCRRTPDCPEHAIARAGFRCREPQRSDSNSVDRLRNFHRPHPVVTRHQPE